MLLRARFASMAGMPHVVCLGQGGNQGKEPGLWGLWSPWVTMGGWQRMQALPTSRKWAEPLARRRSRHTALTPSARLTHIHTLTNTETTTQTHMKCKKVEGRWHDTRDAIRQKRRARVRSGRQCCGGAHQLLALAVVQQAKRPCEPVI